MDRLDTEVKENLVNFIPLFGAGSPYPTQKLVRPNLGMGWMELDPRQAPLAATRRPRMPRS